MAKFQNSVDGAGVADISEERLADYRIAGASRLITIAVAELLDWGMQQLKLFAVDLAAEILDSLSEMLKHADELLTEAERQCLADAEALRMDLQTLRPLGVAGSSAEPPDFFAPVREAFGLGVAGSGTQHTSNLDTPVAATRGTGLARAGAQDIAVLDAPVIDAPGVVRPDTPADPGLNLDAPVDTTRGTGRSDAVDGGPAPQDLDDDVALL